MLLEALSLDSFLTMDTTKNKLLEKSKEYTFHSGQKTVDSCVEQFKKKMMDGPYYFSCVCYRTRYEKSF